MAVNAGDERQPLLSATVDPPAETPSHNTDKKPVAITFELTKFTFALLGRLWPDMPLHHLTILGVFLANADTSLVVATYPSIASEFRDLGNGPWLLTVYTLGTSIALPAVSYSCSF